MAARPRPSPPSNAALEFWQQIEAAPDPGPPFSCRYPARWPDGRVLHLPIRDIGVAGLIVNQASFAVVRALVAGLAAAVRDLSPEVVVGLPTLGHTLAAPLAEALGHANWVAAGYSRKRWYEERLSAPIRSITTEEERRVWLDPGMVARLRGRRVLLVDDVISTGRSARAGVALLGQAGVRPVGLAVAMIQTRRWAEAWPSEIPVRAVLETPALVRREEGWWPA
ncbi:MAG: phosphoribosyltransferase [Acetobacteraceae bacterium]|nr:phosphoribosyltransferase [Acetobacteraceae bacterium]